MTDAARVEQSLRMLTAMLAEANMPGAKRPTKDQLFAALTWAMAGLEAFNEMNRSGQ